MIDEERERVLSLVISLITLLLQGYQCYQNHEGKKKNRRKRKR